jgi:peptide deformylase
MATKLPIVQFIGDNQKILSKKCEPVTEITPEIEQLIEDMVYTAEVSGGIGLAAPQVGKSLQIIVLSGKVLNEDENWIVAINPELEVVSQEQETIEESCLSFPIAKPIPRYKEVQIVAHIGNLEQRAVIYAKDLGARLLQHECDHLQGVTLASPH